MEKTSKGALAGNRFSKKENLNTINGEEVFMSSHPRGSQLRPKLRVMDLNRPEGGELNEGGGGSWFRAARGETVRKLFRTGITRELPT